MSDHEGSGNTDLVRNWADPETEGTFADSADTAGDDEIALAALLERFAFQA